MTAIDRNAAESAFGWQFQVHAAIVLALKNIEDMSSIEVEGDMDDIEVELQNGMRVYCQAKAHYKANEPGNGSTTRLSEAMKTLADDLRKEDCTKAVYVTNDRLLFGKRINADNFSDGAFYSFCELELEQRAVVEKYIGETALLAKVHGLLCFFVLPFFGSDEATKTKAVDAAIAAFLGSINSSDAHGVIPSRLRRIWVQLLGADATVKPGHPNKSISKKTFVWPIVFEMCDKASVGNSMLEIDEDVLEDVMHRHRSTIDGQSDLYSVSTRIISDYEQFRCSSTSGSRTLSDFVSERWEQYVDVLGASAICDDDERRAFVWLVLLKVLKRRSAMIEVSNAVRLHD